MTYSYTDQHYSYNFVDINKNIVFMYQSQTVHHPAATNTHIQI